MSDQVYTKSRCSECLSSLQGMLKRERRSYNATAASKWTDIDYPVLRRSLIDVFEEVFDLCQLQNRDTVAVAVFYLDRFMAVQKRFVNVQIAAMTCFYLAVKLYEPTVIPPAILCELFQRTLDTEDEHEDTDDDASTATVASPECIESMELTVLAALEWNLNPPTAMMFVRQLLCCLPNTNLLEWKRTAMHLAQAHLEVAVKSEEATRHCASAQAVAALFIATEELPAVHRTPVYKFLLQAVHRTAPEDQREVLQIQRLLKQLVSSEATTAEEDASSAEVDQKEEPVLKRTVSSSPYDTEYERPAKKQRFVTSSPRSTLFPVNFGLA